MSSHSERDILIPTDENTIQKAIQRVKLAGGRVTHQFGTGAVVARLPEAASVEELKMASTATESQAPSVRLACEAWRQKVEAEAMPHAPGPEEGLPWDSPSYQAPAHFGDDPEMAVSLDGSTEESSEAGDDEDSGEQASTGTTTSLHLNGSVAVGLVIVSGPPGSAEEMSAAEQTEVIKQAQQGLDFLAKEEPRAKLTFVYDIQPQTVSVSPGADPSIPGAYEKFEKSWREAALSKMGYADPGRPGYQKYVNDIRSKYRTDWAYVAFFTKYPLNHFAYAIWEKVVMHYDNDGWGTHQIHKVFAHESCHIFGAADEYGSCSCSSVHGVLNEPNGNCVNCPTPQVACLMNRNQLTLCPHSRRQIGWDASLFPPSP